MANLRDPGRQFFAHESISVAGTAIGFTAATRKSAANGADARFAFATLETDQIRWTVDGTTPTATVGHLASIGDTIELHDPNNIANFLAIKVTGTATLKVSYAV